MTQTHLGGNCETFCYKILMKNANLIPHSRPMHFFLLFLNRRNELRKKNIIMIIVRSYPYECLCILCDVNGKFIDCDVMYTICIIRNTLGVQNARESASIRRQFYLFIPLFMYFYWVFKKFI